MAKYKIFSGGSTSVLIEVEEGTGSGGSSNFKESLLMLEEVIRTFTETINKLPSKKKPNELKIAFGLKALEDGSLAIPADSSQGNFLVKMHWSNPAEL